MESDVCVLGSGPVAMAIAQELEGAGIETIVVAGGKLAFDPETQSLYSGDEAGLLAKSKGYLLSSRIRATGGTGALWEGACRHFEPWEFEPRSWVPYSPWPITSLDLEPYYRRASEICQVSESLPESKIIEERLTHIPGTRESGLSTRVYRYSRNTESGPRRFAQEFKDLCQHSRNSHLLLDAHAIELHKGFGDKSIERVELGTVGGAVGCHIKSKHYVLATGAVENARLLLASNVRDAGSWTGKCFMTHGSFAIGTLCAWKKMDALSYFLPPGQGGPNRGFRALLDPGRKRPDAKQLSDYTLVVKSELQGSPGIDQTALQEYANAGQVELHGKSNVVLYEFDAIVEQLPNPHSSVTLSHSLDPFGKPRARLDWRLTKTELATAYEASTHLAQFVGQSGIGRMYYREGLHGSRADLLKPDECEVPGHGKINHHQMGTTRMSLDPKQGVVDLNCRQHETSNLFVAGGSVFATAGTANPTFTAVALAVRLAGHLKKIIRL